MQSPDITRTSDTTVCRSEFGLRGNGYDGTRLQNGCDRGTAMSKLGMVKRRANDGNAQAGSAAEKAMPGVVWASD